MPKFLLPEFTYNSIKLASVLGLKYAREVIRNFDGVEIWFPFKNRFRKDFKPRLPKNLDYFKNAFSFHCLFYYHPYNNRLRINYCDPSRKEISLKALISQIEFIKRLDLKRKVIFVLHPGYYLKNSEKEESKETLIEILEKALSHIEDTNILITLENDIQYPNSWKIKFGKNIDELLQVLNHFSGRIGVTFDLAHSLITNNGDLKKVRQDIKKLEKFIRHLHLVYPEKSYINPIILGKENKIKSFRDLDAHSSFSCNPKEIQEKIDEILKILLNIENIEYICCEYLWFFGIQRLTGKSGASLKEILKDIDHLQAISQ